MAANLLTGYSLSMPVYRAQLLPDDAFQIIGATIFGTCFSIGSNFMMTAGHVIQNLQIDDTHKGVVGIIDPEGTISKGALVMETEVLPHDVGVLKVEFTYPESEYWFHRLSWSKDTLVGFEAVRCCGYAYGLHRVEDRQSVIQRCFQGHIVSGLNEFLPLGMDGSPFSVYELSFQVPRGLSGSPLLTSTGMVVVKGVVIGNSNYQMRVFHSREVEQETNATTIIENYESLSLGIAVQPTAMLPLQSLLLNDTIENHLRKVGLLIHG